ncbi:MAG: glycosyltransferase [Thermodesulfobacteriota bacterium]
MSLRGSNLVGFQNIAVVGTYPPRQCGIATFTADLVEAISAELGSSNCWAVAINDTSEGYQYPPKVCFEMAQKDLSDYRLAADFLNMNQVDVVSVQHEFGIFGGQNGRHLLELLRTLRMPVVTTLHTVLAAPDHGQRATIQEVARLSDRVVVMSQRAGELMEEVYGVPRSKVVMIHHGIPDVPFVDPNFYKDQFGLEGRKVVLTFGLLSPGKGIQHMIDALPRIVAHHPEVIYVVLGATHPHVRRSEGESYRLSLQRRAREKGVENHLVFHNRFVSLQELCEFLGAADIYVTPYLNQEQIVSGTLAYALGCGKATISTPYWYAQEMLSDNRGRLVPFQDSEALAEQVLDLLRNEPERHAMRKRAYNFCREMVWKEVARRYLEVFSEVREERQKYPRGAFQVRTLESTPLELPEIKLDHLMLLTDDVGIIQHAKYIVPDRFHGYCTDDNAKALIAVVMAQNLMADTSSLTPLACRYLSFLHHAFNEERGRFRNFMAYDRRWQEDEGTEDSHGRALWGLGVAVGLSSVDSLTAMALHLFQKALPAVTGFTSPRAWAFALVGIHAYLIRFSGHTEVRRVRAVLAERLMDLYRSNAAQDWPWIEEVVTYANGKIPQALLMSGQWLQRGDMVEAGLRSLEWLLQVQTDPKGHFVPIGNKGWYSRGGWRARFDQQPIEAQNMIQACIEAYNVTGEERWAHEARRCFEWFLGRNDLNARLFDYGTGGCCDGLTADGANLNQGAESTLAWLLSLMSMYGLAGAQATGEALATA